jgi:hypothetical protein
MRAGACYRVIVARGSQTPALLASPERLDHVEVVDVRSGEAVLLWDCNPREASRLLRALRADLAGSSAEAFLARWSSAAVR